jgi:hypothetical protein
MSWPPSFSLAFKGAGSTTIKWGTDGIMPNSSPNGNGSGGVFGSYTVESIRPNDEIENIYIENGTGIKSTRIQLWQGRVVTFTVVDDLNMIHPAMGTQVYIIDPMSGDFLLFTVTNNGTNNARKVEGKRDITAEYLTNIEGGGSVPPI